MLGLHRLAAASLLAAILAAAACIEDAVLIEGSGGDAAGGETGTAGGGGDGGSGAGNAGGPPSCDHCPGRDTTCQYRVCDPCDVENARAATPCSEDGGVMCNGLGACVECLTSQDCSEAGDMCIDGQCGTASGANGDPCQQNADCFSGHCSPDGVCCDRACDALCESCLGADNCGSDGTCGSIPAGNDPDDECPSGACFSGSCADGKVVFVTSTTYKGNLGGLDGADDKCNERAMAACMSGSFRAWLSDNTGSPNSRFVQSSIPYRLIDGTIIASNYADLTDGTLSAPIQLTELGGAPAMSPVGCMVQQMSYSATDISGDLEPEHADETCSDWTATTGEAAWGFNTVTNGNWTLGCYGTGGNTCNVNATLYCFQQ